jgi:hypothetical protein
MSPDIWLLLFGPVCVNASVLTKQEPTTTEKPVEKVYFTADIVSSRKFFIVLHHHAIVVKDIKLRKQVQEKFCNYEYLPIQIKYQLSGQQASVVPAYMESGSTELHDEQIQSSICRKI